MSSNPIRVGFIGAGSICRIKHLPGLAAIDGVDVVAVANRSRASAEAVAADFGIPDVEETWQALLARDDIDAVFIGTWPYRHREYSIATLRAGKHCFCQARMAMDLDEAKEMLAVARENPHLVNMLSPARPDYEHYIAGLVRDGELGEITSVELLAISDGNLDRDSLHWRERRELSGNQIMAMGIYAEMLNGVVGPYESLSAHLSTPIGEKVDEAGEKVAIEVPQVVTISGRLQSGALALEHHTGLNADSTSSTSTLTIRGLNGTLRYDLADRLEIGPAGQPLSPVEVPPEHVGTWDAETDFVGAVQAARDGAPPEERKVRPDFEEGLLYMRKVEAVHRSAATGQAVQPDQL